MPKATITFSLPEERYEYHHVTHADNYYRALDEFRNYLRQKLKYEELSAEEYKIFSAIQDKFWEIKKECNAYSLEEL